jgi:hypothetical protein
MNEGIAARTIALWISGLLASGIFGALIGTRLQSLPYDQDGFFGFFGGMLAFACLRLWLAAPQKI